MTPTPDWPTVGPKLLTLVVEAEAMLRGPSYLLREQVVIASLGMGDSWPERARAALRKAEPVIRERCAAIAKAEADEYTRLVESAPVAMTAMFVAKAETASEIVRAIRTGGNP